MYILAVALIVCIAIIIAMVLPMHKISPSNNPICPPAKNSDREFKDTLRYVKDIVPYRDEIKA